ncbi:hypothetical protein Glove_493g23 [Diversispora epigaea]|uniref:Uncharacterized protein n=1 Tax=Diversispora epigaea TaxID=1348612 RepID=A0A397GRN2_9GLOM|nr:hypothetical protein Glove_493g23 [Diversispora epigaea]
MEEEQFELPKTIPGSLDPSCSSSLFRYERRDFKIMDVDQEGSLYLRVSKARANNGTETNSGKDEYERQELERQQGKCRRGTLSLTKVEVTQAAEESTNPLAQIIKVDDEWWQGTTEDGTRSELFPGKLREKECVYLLLLDLFINPVIYFNLLINYFYSKSNFVEFFDPEEIPNRNNEVVVFDKVESEGHHELYMIMLQENLIRFHLRNDTLLPILILYKNVSEDWWKKISISSTKNNISTEQMVESTITITSTLSTMFEETTDLSSSHDTQFDHIYRYLI